MFSAPALGGYNAIVAANVVPLCLLAVVLLITTAPYVGHYSDGEKRLFAAIRTGLSQAALYCRETKTDCLALPQQALNTCIFLEPGPRPVIMAIMRATKR